MDGAANAYPGISTYAFTDNNPIAHKEIDGNSFENPWDAFNVGIGVVSFTANVATGNYLGALVDGVGLIYDGVATAVPILPGVAGTLIKSTRVGKALLSVVKHSDNLYKVGVRGFQSLAKATQYEKVLNTTFKGSVKLANTFWDAGKGGANKLATALKTKGTGNAAHHIIPTKLLAENKNVQKAVNEGFDFNGLVNGVALDKTRHGGGGHADYTEAVANLIDKAFSLDANKGRKASDIMGDITKQIKSDIANSKGSVNDLYKKK